MGLNLQLLASKKSRNLATTTDLTSTISLPTLSMPMAEQTQVVICGGGPTGAILSALLGHLRVPNIVLEREHGITTDPRGIALDEDGVRSLQAIGVYDKIYTQIGSRE